MSVIKRFEFLGSEILHIEPSGAKSFALPLVFIHGAWGNADLFTAWLEHCDKNNITAYAVNLRAADYVSIEFYIQFVGQFAKSVGPVILVGHSMGGLIAQKVAERLPILVKGLVLLASAPSSDIGGRLIHNPRFWFKPSYLWPIIRSKKFYLQKEEALRYVFNGTPDAEAEKIHQKFGPESGLVFWEIAKGVKVGKIYCPVYAVSGKFDRMIPEQIQEGIIKKFKCCHSLVNIDHMIMINDRCGVVDSMIEWLLTTSNR